MIKLISHLLLYAIQLFLLIGCGGGGGGSASSTEVLKVILLYLLLIHRIKHILECI